MSEAYFRSILARSERAHTMPYDVVPSSPPSGRYNSWIVTHIQSSSGSHTVQATRQRTQSEPISRTLPLHASDVKETLDIKAALNIDCVNALKLSLSGMKQADINQTGLRHLSNLYLEISKKTTPHDNISENSNLPSIREKVSFWNNRLLDFTTNDIETHKNILEIIIQIDEIIDMLYAADTCFNENGEVETVQDIIKSYIHKLKYLELDDSLDTYLSLYKVKLKCSKYFLYNYDASTHKYKKYSDFLKMLSAEEPPLCTNVTYPGNSNEMRSSMPIPMPGVSIHHMEEEALKVVHQIAKQLDNDENAIAGYGQSPAAGSGRLYVEHILTNILNLLESLINNPEHSSD